MYSSILGIQQQLGNPYNPILNSTLNELHNIAVDLGDVSYKIGHFIIGLAPYDMFNSAIVDLRTIEHQCYDGNVYVPIPIFMKVATDSLSNTELSTYKLFTTKTYNNVLYNVAYAKRLEDVSSVPNYSFITHSTLDGYNISSLDSKNLNYLTPTVYRESISYGEDIQYIGQSVELTISLTEAEMDNIKSYVDIIYPTRTGENKYTIGEVAILQSQHQSIDSTIELANAQPSYFVFPNIRDIVEDKLLMALEIGDFIPLQQNET